MAEQVKDPIVIKKLVGGASALQVGSGKASGSVLQNTNASTFNQDISQVRSVNGELAAIRMLARVHGDVSATVSAMVRIANTPVHYRVYDVEHQLSEEGSSLLRSIMARMEYSSDYSYGFDDKPELSFKQISDIINMSEKEIKNIHDTTLKIIKNDL